MNTKPKEKHAHPITIVYNLRQFVPLFIIPLVRGFLSALRGDLAGWAKGAWVDILTVLVIIGLSVLNWWYYTYSYDNDGLYLCKGWVRTTKTTLPWNKVATIAHVHRLFLRPVGAIYLRADTLGGNRKKSDFTIYLTQEDTNQLLGTYHNVLGDQQALAEYEPRYSSIILLSFLSTNSFAGIVYIATFVSQSGKILGRNFQDLLISTLEEAARQWVFRIPPAVVAIAYMLLLAWFIGLVLTLLRYRGFKVSRLEHSIRLESGFFTTRDYLVSREQIVYLDIRQNLATYLLRYYSMYLNAIGTDKEKNDINRVIPLEKQIPFKNRSNQLFPGMRDSSLQVRPVARGIFRYIRDPIILCIGLPLIMLISSWLMPQWRRFVLFVGIMAMVPCLILLLVRVADFLTAGIGYRNGQFTLKYSKHFTLHTLIIPKEKVVKTIVRQSLWQKRSGRCNLYVYTMGEKRSVHRIANLNREALEEFLHNIR